MKILRLSLCNLASIAETQHIHFDQAPLAQAGLIAITGKTGAGKSTLLDAMCLALYDRVPRLNGAIGSIQDVAGADLSLKDPKHLLRRGCTSGFAELEFIALDGKRYQARWEVWRAYKKVDGTLKHQRSITCLDEQRVLNQKISEATPIIEQLIGLSFEQFTRAVLLAQSEVGAFLKAKDQERADLLEYLTNSQIFSEVSKKAAEKYSAIKQQRQELEKDIGRIDLLSEEQITTLSSEQKQLNLALEHLRQSEKLLDNDKKWHLERDQLYAEVHGKKEIYDVQHDAMQKLQPQQQLLKQLDEFQAVRENFVQQQKLEDLKQHTKTEQQIFQHSFSSLQHAFAQAQQALHDAQQAQQDFEEQRVLIKPQLALAVKIDHEIQSISVQYKQLNAQMSQFDSERLQPLHTALSREQAQLQQRYMQQQTLELNLKKTEHLQSFDHELLSVSKNLQHYIERYAQLHRQAPEVAKQTVTELEQADHALQQQQQHYEQQYQSLEHLEAQYRQTEQQLKQQQTLALELSHQQQSLQQLVSEEVICQDLQQAIKAQKTNCDALSDHIADLASMLCRKQQDYAQLEQILHTQRLLYNENVQQLRAQLQPEQPCMVCGSLEHPFTTSQGELEANLVALQEQQLQQAKHELDVLQQHLTAQQLEHSKANAVLEQQQQQLEQLTLKCQQQLAQIQHKLQLLGQVIDQQPSQELTLTLAQRLNILSDAINILKQQSQQQHSDLNAWREQEAKAQQLKLHLERRHQLETLIQPILQVFPQFASTQQHLSTLVALEQQLQQRLHDLETQQALIQEIKSTQQSIDKITYQLEVEQGQFKHMQDTLQQYVTKGQDLRQQLLALTEQYAGQAYRVAADWQQAIESQAQQLHHTLAQKRQSLSQAEHALHQANLKQQHVLSQLQHIEQQLAQQQQIIQTWQLAHPAVSHAEIETWLKIDLVQHQRLRHDLNSQQQLLAQAQTAWQLLEERYQNHLQQQPEDDLARIEEKLAVLQLEKKSHQDALDEINGALRLHADKQKIYVQYQQEIEHIKQEEYRWGRIYDLIGHKEGTKFQKIAQEHHLDILVEYANQQLQPLTPRYQLHRIPNSLSLAVIDLDMNSEIRPVLSLSGGETFLVSLALALAIANMAAGSMKLESLFIDEGFGTLDPASLHMVMNALDHLHHQGRKVILISHIQEMHERIPIQIQVKPLGSGASRIQIIG